MVWVFGISSAMIIVGASFSILRDPQTLDYCRTMVRDGRKDEYARSVVTKYNVGLGVLIVGSILLVGAILLAIAK